MHEQFCKKQNGVVGSCDIGVHNNHSIYSTYNFLTPVTEFFFQPEVCKEADFVVKLLCKIVWKL